MNTQQIRFLVRSGLVAVSWLLRGRLAHYQWVSRRKSIWRFVVSLRQRNFQELGPMIGLIMEEQPTMEEILRGLREKYAKESTKTSDPEPRPLTPELERATRE